MNIALQAFHYTWRAAAQKSDRPPAFSPTRTCRMILRGGHTSPQGESAASKLIEVALDEARLLKY
jgi:hypothetical protein